MSDWSLNMKPFTGALMWMTFPFSLPLGCVIGCSSREGVGINQLLLPFRHQSHEEQNVFSSIVVINHYSFCFFSPPPSSSRPFSLTLSYTSHLIFLLFGGGPSRVMWALYSHDVSCTSRWQSPRELPYLTDKHQEAQKHLNVDSLFAFIF